MTQRYYATRGVAKTDILTLYALEDAKSGIHSDSAAKQVSAELKLRIETLRYLERWLGAARR
jgi:hypothetical protein